MTSRRNTIQKDLVKNTVYEMRRHVTANEVYEFIKEVYPTIGKGTVYRNLDILVEECALRKVEVPDGSNRFNFTLKNHYHVRCIKCGEVFDVDMDQIPDLLERIHNTHGIEFVYASLDRVSQIGCQRSNHAMNFHLIIEQCLGRYGLQGIV